MLNREVYARAIDDLKANREYIAVFKNTNNPVSCRLMNCRNCLFCESEDGCRAAFEKWANEYITDWASVPIDTKVIVRSADGTTETNRYYAGLRDGKPAVWAYGTTSWTNVGEVEHWHEIELAE